MSLRYGDRHPRSERFPDCFGRDAYYDSRCTDCMRCGYEQDCRDEINHKKGISVPVERSRTVNKPAQRQDRRGPEERTHAGILLEDETPFQRFIKDCATGACRGFFEEGCEFFRYWRW